MPQYSDIKDTVKAKGFYALTSKLIIKMFKKWTIIMWSITNCLEKVLLKGGLTHVISKFHREGSALNN
jgi:hypothetical protein